MFVFIDETGTDRRAVLRRYMYSFRGKLASAHRWLVRGEHLSTIAKVVTGIVNGDVFYNFVQENILPHCDGFPKRTWTYLMCHLELC